MPAARPHKPIIRKKEKKIKRMHSHRFKRVDEAWRRPRGIDCPLRRRYKGYGAMPTIGYRTDKATRFMDKKDGFKRVLVHNIAELEPLMMHNRTYKAVIASSVGGKKRRELLQRARELDIFVENKRAKFVTEERE